MEYEGKTAQFEVTVRDRQEPAPALKSLEITKTGKTEYRTGEEFSREGMEVTVYYTDGSSKTVDAYEVSGFDSDTEGRKILTVSYTEDEITVSAVMEITVVKESDGSGGQQEEDKDDPDNTQGQPKPGNTGDADPVQDRQEPEGKEENNEPGSDSVQTGDESGRMMVFCLSAAFLSAAAAAGIWRKKCK